MPIIATRDYDLNEAAKICHLAAPTLRKMLNQGKIHGHRVAWGKREKWIIPGTSLLALRGKGPARPIAPYIKEWEVAQATGMHSGKPISPRGLKANQYGLNKFWEYSGAPQVVESLTSSILATALAAVPIEREDQNCHFSQRDQLYKAVISLAKHLATRGLLPPQEVLAMRKLKPRRVFDAKRTWVSGDKVFQMADAALTIYKNERSLSTRVLILLLGLAGLRRNEAIAVELDHVDFEQGFIWVMDGKGHRDGIAPMPHILEQAIHAWLKVRPESDFKNLLLLNDGTPITESAILRRVTRLAEAVKSPDLTPHGLRRAAATYWHNDKGLSLHQTSVLLRHRNVSTTQGYLMTDVRDLIQSMRKPETPLAPSVEASKPPVMAGIFD